MLEADEERVQLDLTGWELEELYQALVLKRETHRVVSDVDDYCLLERIEGFLDAEDKDYCIERAQQYSKRLARIFIEYGRLEQFQYDHGWEEGRGRATPHFLTDSIHNTIKAAFERQQTVEIEYEAQVTSPDASTVSTRLIDIYSISNGYIKAYCHTRRAVRVFRADRILDAKLTLMTYEIPDGFVPTV